MSYAGGTTDVKSSTVTSSGRVPIYTGSSTYIARARIKAVNANPSAAEAIIKLYNGTSAVGASIVLQVKFGSAAEADGLDMYIPQNGILCPDGVYADLTNCDSCTIVWQS
jgi:hypothetical protein